MKSLQEYRNIYREIASKLNLQGDSVELLVQMLSQASYIGDIESAAYMKEASLESSTLLNSKIQHCMDNMYSVFRGTCPRVIIKFKPTKYFDLSMYDVLSTSNNFKVYYLGYWGSEIAEEGFKYGPIKILPGTEDVVLIGLLAKEFTDLEWAPSKDKFYVESEEENLSEDLYVEIDGVSCPVTRNFDDHILNGKIYDLTVTSFGSRLYFPDALMEKINNSNVSSISARYFKKTSLSDYNSSELKKITISGAQLSTFKDTLTDGTDGPWMTWLNERGYDDEVATGILLIDSTGADSIDTIHYRASKDRFVSSIIRSNSDVGTVLEEMYPEKIVLGGTTYSVHTGDGDNTNVLYIYYIPDNENNLLTSSEINEFTSTKKAYYITDNIIVKKGYCKRAIIDIDVDLYQNTSIDSEVENILSGYEKKFGIDITDTTTIDKIKVLLGKISNVAGINNVSVAIDGSIEDIDKTYYNLETTIHSKIIE